MEFVGIKQEPHDNGYEMSNAALCMPGNSNHLQQSSGPQGRDEPKLKHPKLTTLLFGNKATVNTSNNNSHLSKLLASRPKYVLKTTSEQRAQSPSTLHTTNQQNSQSATLIQTTHQYNGKSATMLQNTHLKSSQSAAILQNTHQQNSKSTNLLQTSHQLNSQLVDTLQAANKQHNQSVCGLKTTEKEYSQSPTMLQTTNRQCSQSANLLQTTNVQHNQAATRSEGEKQTETDLASYDVLIKKEVDDDYEGFVEKPTLPDQGNKVHNHKSSTSSCPEKNPSILSLLKSGPAYSPSFSMDTLSYQSTRVPVAMETISKRNNIRHVPLEPPGYQDNSYPQVNFETIEREPRGRAYTMGIMERQDDSEYIPSVPHRTRSNTGSSISVLQKSHKRLSDLLTGPSSLLSSRASPTPEKPAEMPNCSLSKSGSLKCSKTNSALLQRLLTIGPSGYVRHGPLSESEAKETTAENTSNGTENVKQNNASSALLTLLRGRKQNEIEEKTDNRLGMKAELEERLKLSVPHQNPERKTTGKLDATIEKLSSMLVDKVIQGTKSCETELPPLQVPSPGIETYHQESPLPVAKEHQPKRPSLLKALVKEKIYKEQEKVEREAFLLETLKRSLAEPREELVAHLPFPGKDFLNFYKCEYCGKAFPHKGTLKVHMRTHSMEKQEFKCDVCGKVCSAKGYLLIHMRTHRQEYGPSQEEEVLTTRDENPPLGQKTAEEMNGCSICGKTFSESENLLIHLRMHSGEKLYKCEVCGNGFTRKTQLAIHMRIHTGEKPYECEVCGKTFRQSNGLNLHMITHSEVKPYNCQNCGAGFGRKAHYEKHMRWHRGERPFHCAVCGKGFTDKFNLSTHFKIHNQKKDHVCDVCGKGYNQATHLKNHMQFHAGERGYQCSDCDCVFEHKRTLQNHIKFTHFDTYEKSLTSKTSLRKFQKLRAHGMIVENTSEQEQSSESSSDDSTYDDSMLSDGDDMYSGEEKFVIKNEPGDWCSDYTEDAGQPNKRLESSYEGVGQSGEGVGLASEEVGQAGEGVGLAREEVGQDISSEDNKLFQHNSQLNPTGSMDDQHCEKWNGISTGHIKQEVVDVYPGETESDFNDKSQGQSSDDKSQGQSLDNLHKISASEKEHSSENSVRNRGQIPEVTGQNLLVNNLDRDIHTEVSTISIDRTVVKTEPNYDEIVQETVLENTVDSLNCDDMQSERIQHSLQSSENSHLNYMNDYSNKRTIQLDLSVTSTYDGERREFNGISNHDSSDSEQGDRFYIRKKSMSQNGEISPQKKRRIGPESPEPLKIGGDESSSKGDKPDHLHLQTANRKSPR